MVFFFVPGLKSYGKMVHGYVLTPVIALIVLTIKIGGLVENPMAMLGLAEWSNFFFHSHVRLNINFKEKE